MKTLFVVEGTWSRRPYGMTYEVIKKLDTDWNIVPIDYPQSLGDPISFHKSVNTGQLELETRMSECKTPYSIIGYSQGALIAGNAAQHYHDDDKFISLHNIADPARSPDDILVGPAVPGIGLYGSRYVGPKCRQYVVPGDWIASCDNPKLANMARYVYDLSWSDWAGWARSVPNATRSRQQGGSYANAFITVTKSLVTGAHVRYADHVVSAGRTVPEHIAVELTTAL